MSAERADRDQHALIRRTLAKLDELELRLRQEQDRRTEPIAIVGMACRFPGGADHPDRYWRLLANGVDATSEVPPDRWDRDTLYDPDPDAPGKIVTRRGSFVDRIDAFDARFFRISAHEAESLDPQQRLLLEVSWEALEHANVPADRLYRQPVGVFVGVTRCDYAMGQMTAADPRQITGFTGTGSGLGMGAGRLSFFLGVTGPSLIVDTACSSSLVSLHLACDSLRRGECAMALAGGVNLQIRPEMFIAMSRAHMLAPDGRCKTFAASADGIGLGDGAGMLVLKRLSDARAAGDRILALVRGSAINQDGPSGGLTVPNGPSQEQVIRQALANAGVDAADVSYVEAHGTGTPLGDPIEIGALGAVFGDRAPDRPLFVGSVKTNLGHLESAAGVSGVIKVVLSFLNESIPPHLHFTEPNPRIAWDRWPLLRVTSRAVPWKRGPAPRLAGISGFGVSGTNAHVILEEAPAEDDAPAPRGTADVERPRHLLALSAKSDSALRALADRYVTFLDEAPDAGAADVCFTANTGRSAFTHRLCVIAADARELRTGLADFAAGRANRSLLDTVVKRERPPRIAFLFTGQGAQYAGMGRRLYDTEPLFRQAIDRCADVLAGHFPQPLVDVLYPRDAGGRDIDDTAFAQPALFAVEYALAALWGSWGIRPDVVLGHSVGEYVAACRAGVFTLDEGLRLVAERGRLMSALPRNGAMVAVFASAVRVADAIRPHAASVSLAAINAHDRVVVSGDRAALDRALAGLRADGVETHDLHVSHAFHSPLIEPMLDDFAAATDRARFQAPSLPLVSNVTGRRLAGDATPDAAYWRRHTREPVDFARGLDTVLEDDGDVVCIEIGPQPVLATLGQRAERQPRAWLPSLIRGQDDWQVMLRSLAQWSLLGGAVDWAGLDRNRPRRRLTLPFYPFERKRYWILAAPCAAPASATETSAVGPESTVTDHGRHGDGAVPDPPGAEAWPRTVRAGLIEIMSGLLGIEASEIDDREPFLEMGADSILLIRAIRDIDERFGVALKVRQFFEDVPDLASMIEFVAARAKPPAASVQPREPVQSIGAASALDASRHLPTAASVSHGSVPPAGGATPLERVILAQLQLMSQQLAALGAGAAATTALGTAAGALSRELHRERSAAPGDAADAGAADTSRDRSSPLRALEAGPRPSGKLTPVQQRHLDDLIARHTAKTRRSKELAAASRPVLADSRASFGFRFSTKELLYPITASEARGSTLVDVDGNTYVDLTMGFGALLFGNQPRFVTDAVRAEMDRGIQLGPRSDLLLRVAERFTAMTGTERVAFNNSGTEAVMTALRLARTKTGRSRIAMFEGAYHGHADGTLVGSRVSDGQVRSFPLVSGVPENVADNVLVLPYGAPTSLDALRACAGDLAAVLVEPVQSRRPDLRPVEFLREVRRLTAAAGTALVLDEMITGFRVHPGGIRALWGVDADLTTYGKIVGGGLAVGAIAGTADWLDAVDGGPWSYGDRSYPAAEKTYFAGTFCQHPFVMAAALAVLEHLEAAGPALQRGLDERTARLVDRLNAWFEADEVPIRVVSFSSWFLFTSDVDLELFYYHMLDEGVYICEGRSCFVSTAHTDADLDHVVRAVQRSVAALRDGGFLPRPATATPARHGDAERRDVGALRHGRDRVNAEPALPDEVPLSAAQRQLAFLVRMDPEGSLAYHDPTCIRLRGPLDVDAMRRALAAVVARHEALRTVIDRQRDVQRVLPEISVPLPLRDVADLAPVERESAAAAWLAEVCARPLDPVAGPVFRVELLRLAADEHLMALNVHHVLVDGWSVAVMLRDLGRFYSAYCRDEAPRLEPPMQFRRWLAWRDEDDGSEAMAVERDWWLERFRAPVTPPAWPTAATRPPIKTWKGGRRSLHLDADLVRAVRAYAGRHGCTVFMAYFAVHAAWLHRLTGQDDLVIGTPTAGRALEGAGDVVGYCTHLLPIRSSSAGDPPFSEFLTATRSRLLDAYDHERHPFARLIDALDVRHDPGRSPLVDTVFNFEVPASPTLHGLAIESVDCPVRHTAFDLTLSVSERAGTTIVDCDYDAALFDAATADGFLEQFRAFLGRITDGASPDPRMSALSLMSEAEKRRIVEDWGHGPALRAAPMFADRFEARAIETPDRIALVHGDRELSYGALNRRANRIAHFLQAAGVGADVVVGLCMERTPDLCAAILGVLKAGGAYLPLDPAYPRDRLAFMARDARTTLVLADVDGVVDTDGIGARVVRLDREPLASFSDADPHRAVTPAHLSYVMYTSGSTGRPKGVAVTHGSVAALATWTAETLAPEPLDGMLFSTSVCFDLSVFELLVTLGLGGTIVLARDALELAGGSVSRTIRLVNTVPSAMAEVVRLNAVPETVRVVCLCGEPLSGSLVDRLHDLGHVEAVYNLYGPTEDTTYSTWNLAPPGIRPAIGRPLHGSHAYLLDRHREPVPAGTAAELYLGGAGLARGYLGRPGQTAERFVPDPVGDEPGARLYRTGDLCRHRPDGELEFLGRIDHQVKIRGFRVEPDEIGAVLGAHPAIADAVVVARDGARDGLAPATKTLVAYVRPGEAGTTPAPLVAELRRHLEAALPEHMIPLAFVVLDAFPRTPNGKIDRAALPAPDLSGGETAETAPQTQAEELVAGIWSDVLGVPRIATGANFFDLGGHSLLAARVISRIRDQLGVEVPFRALFESPTVHGMAAKIEHARTDGGPSATETPIARSPRDALPPLSFAQQRLWFLDRLTGPSAVYNMGFAVRLDGELDVAALEHALAEITRRHEILRTSIVDVDGEGRQRIAADPRCELRVVALDEPGSDPSAAAGERASDAHQSATLDRLLATEAQRPFDLARGPLLRTALIRLAQDAHVLTVTMHHVVSDGWSIGVFVGELSTLYDARRRHAEARLPALPIQYADYAVWQRTHLAGERLAERLAFWTTHLDGAPALLELPADRPRPPVQRSRGRTERFTLDRGLTDRLRTLGRETGATLYMTLLAGYAAVLSRYAGSDDAVIGSPFANRTRSEIEPMIGLFVNTLPLRVRLDGGPTVRELLARVRRTALDAQVHQDLPFERLVDALALERTLSVSPVFQVVFALQNVPPVELRLSGVTWTEIQPDTPVAKWDLNLAMEERDGVLRGEWEYDADLFDGSTVERMIGHFRTVLTEMCAAPDQPVSRISLLTHEEQRQLTAWNDTARRYARRSHAGGVLVEDLRHRPSRPPLDGLMAQPLDGLAGPPLDAPAGLPLDAPTAEPLHGLVEAQAAATPERIAVAFGDTTVTYGELNRRANRLARLLRTKGVDLDVPVALFMDRSIELVVAMLAVLKAGGAYLPLDPDYPRERVAFMLRDAQPPVVLTQERLSGELPPSGAEVLCADTLDLDGERDDDHRWARVPPLGWARVPPLDVPVPDDAAAYVIYTSGSTGRPKGAINTHGAIRNRLLWMQETYRLDARDRVLQKTPASFDVSVWEFFWPLIAGARLVLAEPGAHRDAAALVRVIGEQRVTVMHFVPSMLDAFLDEPTVRPAAVPSLRTVIASGEALTGRHRDRFFAALPHVTLHNLYGPTEAAIDVTAHACAPRETHAQVPIGRPIANVRIHLLDRHGAAAPVGVPGELHIAGASLARGYLSRPALTAEKFVPDPLAVRPGERAYRTGDLARRAPDGEIEFLGRIDHQVKIRGFRIELGEIEAALAAIPGVERAVAITAAGPGGAAPRTRDPDLGADGAGRRLVAYVVTRDVAAVEARDPRGTLARTLPDHMIPSAFVYLDALPLTPSGKVDRRALPAPEALARRAAWTPPATPAEEILAAIWSSTLGVGRVGADDGFFDLGGDSILAIKVIAQAARAGLGVSLADLFRHGTVRELARVAAAAEVAAPLRVEPFALLTDDQRAGLPADAEDAYPLTRLQAGMLFHSELAPESAVYHDVFSYLIQAPLDIERLRRAFQSAADRHPSLRTSFVTDDAGESVQVVHRHASIEVTADAVPDPSLETLRAARDAWITAEKRRPFDPARAPLLRVHVHHGRDGVRGAQDGGSRDGGPERFVLTLSFHHAILDGWSVVSLLADVFGDAVIDAPRAVGVRDLVARERQAIASGEARDFWRAQVDDATVAALPRWPAASRTEEPAAADVAEETVAVTAGVSEGVKAFATSAGVPLKSALLAAHLRVLAWLSGVHDAVTGITVNVRPEATGGERVLGLFLNTLPLRLRVMAGTWRDLARAAWEAERALWPHRHVPLFEVQRLAGGAPLFEAAFNFTNFHVYRDVRAATGLEVLDFRGFEQTTFTLTANFGLDHASGRVALVLAYDPAELVPSQIREIASVYASALRAMAQEPDGRHDRHAWLSERDARRLLVEANATRQPAPPFPTFVDAFEAQARAHPDRLAVVADGAALSYAALDRRANQLAHHLRRLGAGPETPVAVCMERTPDLIVALVAIGKAGAAFLPMDPANPPERLAFMLRDAGATLVLARRTTAAAVAGAAARPVLLDADDAAIAREATTAPARRLAADHLAYVIYTSGSTGAPKGALLTHGGLANYLEWCRRRYESHAGDDTMAPLHLSIGFDATLTSVFSPLHVGRTVYLVPEGDELDVLAQGLATATPFGVVKVTPAHLDALAIALDDHRPERQPGCLVVGGEALHEDSLAAWRRRFPATRIYNEYGPTECVVGCCVHDATETDPSSSTVPIGRPIDNVRLYVVDRGLNPVGVATAGELLIGGAQVARGYLGRAALTAERFIPDPFGQEPGARLYRSGDLARWLPGDDVRLEFLGRLDDQVKIRGYRIEPGEIEAALLQDAHIARAVVVARGDRAGDRRLVAYVQPMDGDRPDVTALRQRLQARLPEHMVPSAVVCLESLPLTAHGKVDRRALPAPERPETAAPPAAPRTPAEMLLTDLWTEVLGRDRAGIDDDFFESGGHSLLATRLVARIRERLAIDLPLRALFEAPTPRTLAERIATAERGAALPPIRRVSRDEPLPLSFAQQGLWLVERLRGPSSAYNIAAAIRLRGPLAAGVLARAFAEIVRRHEVLRTSFREGSDGARQVITSEVRAAMPLVSLEDRVADEQEQEVCRLAAEEAQRPFDLERDPLLRTRLVRLAPDHHVVTVAVHHIVADGWSIGVFLRELGVLYEAFRDGAPSPLPELPVQYADFAASERAWLDERALAAPLASWREELRGMPQPFEIPADRPRRNGTAVARGALARVELDPAVLPALRALNRREHVTMFMTLLAAFDVALWCETGRDDVVVGTDVANRRRAEVEGLIGFFVNQLVLRARIAAGDTFDDLLRRVRATTLDAYARQEVPFALLVRELVPDRDGSPSPLFRIKLVLQNAADETLRLPGIEAEVLPGVATDAKFDLIVNVEESSDRLVAIVDYDADRYLDATVRRLVTRYEQVLREIGARSETPLDALRERLAVLDAGERRDAAREARSRNLDALKALRGRRAGS